MFGLIAAVLLGVLIVVSLIFLFALWNRERRKIWKKTTIFGEGGNSITAERASKDGGKTWTLVSPPDVSIFVKTPSIADFFSVPIEDRDFMRRVEVYLRTSGVGDEFLKRDLFSFAEDIFQRAGFLQAV